MGSFKYSKAGMSNDLGGRNEGALCIEMEDSLILMTK